MYSPDKLNLKKPPIDSLTLTESTEQTLIKNCFRLWEIRKDRLFHISPKKLLILLLPHDTKHENSFYVSLREKLQESSTQKFFASFSKACGRHEVSPFRESKGRALQHSGGVITGQLSSLRIECGYRSSEAVCTFRPAFAVKIGRWPYSEFWFHWQNNGGWNSKPP